MEQFLVIFREPDGRQDEHYENELSQHRLDWQIWLNQLSKEERLKGGSALSLEGRVIDVDRHIIANIHQVGTEIVGGFLIFAAENLDKASEMISSCPIFDFGGYAEVRPFKAS